MQFLKALQEKATLQNAPNANPNTLVTRIIVRIVKGATLLPGTQRFVAVNIPNPIIIPIVGAVAPSGVMGERERDREKEREREREKDRESTGRAANVPTAGLLPTP